MLLLKAQAQITIEADRLHPFRHRVGRIIRGFLAQRISLGLGNHALPYERLQQRFAGLGLGSAGGTHASQHTQAQKFAYFIFHHSPGK